MDIKTVTQKITEAREASKQRNFVQTFDLIINLQNLDLRKPEHKVDLGISLECQAKDKKYKVAAIVDHAISGAEKVFDKVIYNDELAALKGNMQEIRKITHGYDKFVVQVNVMPQFAQVLGRYLGPMNKMPSPKLGMVINPKTDLEELYAKLQKVALLQTKKNLVLQVAIGSEKEKDEVIAKNIVHIREALIHALPGHENNLKDIRLKLTMGNSVVL
jgi:large subunit ribosomal protein L1